MCVNNWVLLCKFRSIHAHPVCICLFLRACVCALHCIYECIQVLATGMNVIFVEIYEFNMKKKNNNVQEIYECEPRESVVNQSLMFLIVLGEKQTFCSSIVRWTKRNLVSCKQKACYSSQSLRCKNFVLGIVANVVWASSEPQTIG